MTPETQGMTGTNAPDPFDQLLTEPAAAAPSAGPRQQILVDSHPAPDLQQFRESWALFQDPVLCGILAGIGLGAPGVFVLLRRSVFVTAALTQAAGLGVALAFYAEIHLGLGVPPVLGALLTSIAATLIGTVGRSRRMARETRVGLVFIAASALAVLVGDRIAQEAHDIAAILFGSAVLVRPSDLWMVLGGTSLTLLLLAALTRALSFTGFDPEGARVQGLPVRGLEATFWVLFAVQVSVTTRALGSLPVFAFSVLPAMGALFLAKRLRGALLLSMALGALAGGLGYLLAFLNELPVGATQAATAVLLATLAYGISRVRR